MRVNVERAQGMRFGGAPNAALHPGASRGSIGKQVAAQLLRGRIRVAHQVLSRLRMPLRLAWSERALSSRDKHPHSLTHI